MKINISMTDFSEILLSNHSHPGDSANETVTGDAVKGDGYMVAVTEYILYSIHIQVLLALLL